MRKTIILLSGKMFSGKNTVSEYIQKEFEAKGFVVKQDLYARDLKQYTSEDFDVLGNVLQKKVDKLKATIGVFLNSRDFTSAGMFSSIEALLDEFTFRTENFYEEKTDITRVLLQTYGTDIARKRFDNDFWLKKMCERFNSDKTSDVIIVTDVRFENEIDSIGKFVNGWRIIPIRIDRDIERYELINEHISETALDNYEFWEYMVSNNGNLEDLKNSAIEIVNQISD